MRQILHKPDACGRLMKWAIKLSVYDIEYRLQKMIKAQMLSDFILECTNHPDESNTNKQEPCLTSYIDGSSRKKTQGDGFILQSPEGTRFAYALKYTF